MNFPRNIPFRVLYLDHTARLGGGEIALFNLVTNIQTDRCTPIVVLGETGPLQQRLVAAGIETHVLPLAHGVADVRKDSLGAGVLLRFGDILHAIAYCIRLRRFILERHIDLVHTNSLKSDLLGGVAARLAGRPVIWHIRDRIADDYLPARTASTFRWLASWLPTHVIANSQSTLRTLDPGVSRRTFHSPFSTNHPLPVGGTVVYSGTTESTRDSVVHDGTFSGNPVQRGGTTNLAAPAPTEGHLGS